MSERKRLKEGRQKRLIATPLIIRALFKNVTGNDVSLKYIQKAHDEQLISKADQSLTYGEVVPSSFLQILGYVAPTTIEETDATFSRTFYDLGCGTGRAVICAALSPHPFSKVVGIELVPDLCDAALGVKGCLLEAITESCEGAASGAGLESKVTARNSLPEGVKGKSKKEKEMKILSGDQLVFRIKEIVLRVYNDGGNASTQEYICNELTKELGHKLYRSSLQPLGKFSKFIASKTDSFSFSNDGSLLPRIADLPNKMEIRIEDDESVNNVDATSAEVDNFHGNVQNDCVLTEESVDLNSINMECIHIAGNENNSITAEVIDIPSVQIIDADVEPADKHHVHTKESKISAIKSILTAPTGFLTAILPLPEIVFIEGDIFLHNWYVDADVVYAASLLFTDNMMEKLTHQVMKMKRGAWIISLKPLITLPGFREKVFLKDKSFHKMSWHMAEVYSYLIIS